MSINSITEVFNSFISVILQALEFIVNLPFLLFTLIDVIPDPFRTSFLSFFPIIIGIFIWKLWKG